MFNYKLVSKASKSPNGIKPQLWEQERSLCMHQGGVAVPWVLIPIAATIPRAERALVPWQLPCRTGPAPGSHSHVHPVPPVPQPQVHLSKGSLGQDRVRDGGGLESKCLVLLEMPGSQNQQFQQLLLHSSWKHSRLKIAELVCFTQRSPHSRSSSSQLSISSIITIHNQCTTMIQLDFMWWVSCLVM